MGVFYEHLTVAFYEHLTVAFKDNFLSRTFSKKLLHNAIHLTLIT